MDEQVLERLLEDIAWLKDNAEFRRKGVVTGTSPFTVDLADSGVSVSAKHVDSYTPVLNDEVVVFTRGRDAPLVVGTVT